MAFANEFERQLAAASGADLSTTPQQAAMIAALKDKETRDRAKRQSYLDTAFPVQDNMQNESWVNNVIESDLTGIAKKILLRQNGYEPSYAAEVGAGVQKRDYAIHLDRFSPSGKLQPDGNYTAETSITGNEDFAKLMRTDPRLAASLYKKLAGSKRDLAREADPSFAKSLQDLQEAERTRKEVEAMKLRVAAQSILSGEDKFDPQTKSWWTQERVPTGETDLNGRQIMETRAVDSSRERGDTLTKYYKLITGSDLPEADMSGKKEMDYRLKPKGSTWSKPLGITPTDQNDPNLAKALEVRKRQLGVRTLTPQQVNEVIDALELHKLNTYRVGTLERMVDEIDGTMYKSDSVSKFSDLAPKILPVITPKILPVITPYTF